MKKVNVLEEVIVILCIWNLFQDLLRDLCIDRCMMSILNIEKGIQEVDLIKNLKKIKKKEADLIKKLKKRNH